MDGMEGGQADGVSQFPSHIRLVWSNPTPPRPRRPMNLAVAIERHLAGQDGLTDDQFVTLFAKG
jgi:hypothetical protein